MDIDEEQNHLCFTYVLPMDNKTALIEVTYYSENIFSHDHYEKKIKKYIDLNFSQNEFKIQKKKWAQFPL